MQRPPTWAELAGVAADVAAAGIAVVDFAVVGVDAADVGPSSSGRLRICCPVGGRTLWADVVATAGVPDEAAGTAPDDDADAVVVASAVDADAVVAAPAVDAGADGAVPDVAGAEVVDGSAASAVVDARALSAGVASAVVDAEASVDV